MSIVALPPQVKLVCDSCHEAMSWEEWMVQHFDADDPMQIKDALEAAEWRTNEGGTHTCESCVDEEDAKPGGVR